MPLRNKPTKKKYSPKNTPIKYADTNIKQEYARIEKALGNCHFLSRSSLRGSIRTS